MRLPCSWRPISLPYIFICFFCNLKNSIKSGEVEKLEKINLGRSQRQIFPAHKSKYLWQGSTQDDGYPLPRKSRHIHTHTRIRDCKREKVRGVLAHTGEYRTWVPSKPSCPWSLRPKLSIPPSATDTTFSPPANGGKDMFFLGYAGGSRDGGRCLRRTRHDVSCQHWIECVRLALIFLRLRRQVAVGGWVRSFFFSLFLQLHMIFVLSIIHVLVLHFFCLLVLTMILASLCLTQLLFYFQGMYGCGWYVWLNVFCLFLFFLSHLNKNKSTRPTDQRLLESKKKQKTKNELLIKIFRQLRICSLVCFLYFST